MGISKISQYARALGLGDRTGVDLPGERPGVMPSPEWKLQTRKAKWFAGETISVSIGQGAVSVTPTQIVRAISAIASDGLLTTPHVLLREEGNALAELKLTQARIPMDPDHGRRIRQGMWESVNRWGTGHNAAVPGVDICGKTGTVQVVSAERKAQSDSEYEDHSWFVGFGNRDNPEIAVVAFVEHGGKGGVAAAPLARQIFSAYFEKKKSELSTKSQPPAMDLRKQEAGLRYAND
jgi:penicillin-binding protein 2